MSQRLEKGLKGGKMNAGVFDLNIMRERQMRNKMSDNREIKQEIDAFHKGEFYFLFVMLVIIVTFSLFKSEILHLIFSHLV